MDLSLTEEQEMIKSAARDFVQRKCDKRTLLALDKTETGFSPEIWKETAELGWLGMASGAHLPGEPGRSPRGRPLRARGPGHESRGLRAADSRGSRCRGSHARPRQESALRDFDHRGRGRERRWRSGRRRRGGAGNDPRGCSIHCGHRHRRHAGRLPVDALMAAPAASRPAGHRGLRPGHPLR